MSRRQRLLRLSGFVPATTPMPYQTKLPQIVRIAETGASAKQISKAFDADNESELPYRPPNNPGTSRRIALRAEDFDDLEATLEVHYFRPEYDFDMLAKDGAYHGIVTKRAKEKYL